MSEAPRPAPVGNDVLDLADDRFVDRHRHDRFLERVFDDRERGAIAADPDPTRAIRLRWAAKEAAFKFVSKLRGVPTFEHAAFGTELEGLARGTVRWRDLEIPVRFETGDGWIHALTGRPHQSAVEALDPALPAPRDPAWEHFLASSFSPRERGAVHSAASAGVRLAARNAVAAFLSEDSECIEIVCAGPTGRGEPRVRVGGRLAPVEVSLSHDGRWIAWALSG